MFSSKDLLQCCMLNIVSLGAIPADVCVLNSSSFSLLFFLLLIQITREKHVMNLLCDLSHECSSTSLGFLERHFAMTSVVMCFHPCHGDSRVPAFSIDLLLPNLLVMVTHPETHSWDPFGICWSWREFMRNLNGQKVTGVDCNCTASWLQFLLKCGCRCQGNQILYIYFFVVTQGSGFHVYLQKHLQCTWKPWPHWTWRGNSHHLAVVASAEVLGSFLLNYSGGSIYEV